MSCLLHNLQILFENRDYFLSSARWDDDHIASDLFNIHVVTEFSRDVRILTYNWCVLKLNR